MNDLNLSETGYSVYLLYQKEVYSSDHSFLQSMMDWLYTSSDSPLKFYFRNKAQVNIAHNGILIRKDTSLNTSSNENSHWSQIYFNFKHLKEIYVDKRHKDTCVLVSKVSSSTTSNYVWKKTNPSNYQSFRSAYSLNSAYKKTFLLTILKFKDGPSRLLQTIQLLDSVLVDYNKKEELINKSLKSNPELTNIIYNTLKGSDNLKNSKIVKNIDFIKSTSRHSMDNFVHKVQKNSSNLSLNQFDVSGTSTLNRLRNRSQQYIGQKPTTTLPASLRNHSVDTKSLYQNVNNGSNTSLQSFQTNSYFYRPSSSNNVSRQSSVNDLRPQNAPFMANRGYLGNILSPQIRPTSVQHEKKPQPYKQIEKSKKDDVDNLAKNNNIKIKLVNEAVNFENNISESSENEDFETSTNQAETVIERKQEQFEEDTTKNDYDDTNTNTILEDLSHNMNTETINDSNLDTINNFDFSSTGKNLIKIDKNPQNFYYNFTKDDFNNLRNQSQQQQQQQNHHQQQFQHQMQHSQIRPILNQNKIANIVRNASIPSTSGINDEKSQDYLIKETNNKVRDIINSFNNLNLNKKPEVNINPMPQQTKTSQINNTTTNSNKITYINSNNNNFTFNNVNNNGGGNRFPPPPQPTKAIHNNYNNPNLYLNKNYSQISTQLGVNSNTPNNNNKNYESTSSISLNVNTVDSFYAGNYLIRPKLESPVKINNDFNLINNKLTRIVNYLSSSSDNLNEQSKKLDIEVRDTNFNNNNNINNQVNEDYFSQTKVTGSHPPVAAVAPIAQKKRTFANMVWPMDPEEEKILRSSSPFIVPEVIVQKPERVKSILKKSNCFLTNSVSGFDLTSSANQPLTQSSSVLGNYTNSNSGYVQSASMATANKKRVDFHENFCYINFFDTNEEN
ncbi:unnamed protein product [Brachionus calyciflorus]|uniref:Uncharacterized protein n=1 Tax=Brachionus calyciflorus TaxID=104777 RepID=A0A813M1Y9_9BILA|nr:unnamed protein product [Brachionus calyciflorus]